MQCMTIWIKISIECINVNYSRITVHTCAACFRFENDYMNLFLAQETSELRRKEQKPSSPVWSSSPSAIQ